MNFKQIMGVMLLMVMCITAYALFGAGAIPTKAIPPTIKLNESVTPQIEAYKGITMEEHATVDGGCIAVMLILMAITTLGSLPKPKIYPEKGSKEELTEENDD